MSLFISFESLFAFEFEVELDYSESEDVCVFQWSPAYISVMQQPAIVSTLFSCVIRVSTFRDWQLAAFIVVTRMHMMRHKRIVLFQTDLVFGCTLTVAKYFLTLSMMSCLPTHLTTQFGPGLK